MINNFVLTKTRIQEIDENIIHFLCLKFFSFSLFKILRIEFATCAQNTWTRVAPTYTIEISREEMFLETQNYALFHNVIIQITTKHKTFFSFIKQNTEHSVRTNSETWYNLQYEYKCKKKYIDILPSSRLYHYPNAHLIFIAYSIHDLRYNDYSYGYDWNCTVYSYQTAIDYP